MTHVFIVLDANTCIQRDYPKTADELFREIELGTFDCPAELKNPTAVRLQNYLLVAERETPPMLSENQRMILTLLSMGASEAEIARAMQLIKWRQQRNKQQPSKEHKTTASPTVTLSSVDEVILTSPADKRFREQVEVLVGQHLTDQNFSIDQLAAMLTMGRTKFYGKMKELYGMSPNKYLMKRRMDKAAELLLEGKYTVSEVSYRVGIPDSSYFNKCFKAAFGTVPSKYRG